MFRRAHFVPHLTCLLVVLASGVGTVRADVVYDNTANSAGFTYGPQTGTNEFGNTITLAGSSSNRYVTNFTTATELSPSSLYAGTETARIRFYNVGADHKPSSLIYDSGPQPVQQGINLLSVTPNAVVSDTFVWVIQYGGLAVGEKGVLFAYYPPTVGSCVTNFWLTSALGAWQLLAFGGNNPGSFFAQISAGPTPQQGTPPVITAGPQSQVVFAGADVTFDASVSGSPPLRYQWTFNGANLAGATNISLTLHNLATNQSGPYAIVVSNASGTVTSTPPAVLNVILGQVVYDNTTNFTTLIQSSADEFGNQITLAGSSTLRDITYFKFQYYLATNNVTGNERVRLRFYSNTGLNGEPGRMYYDGGTVAMAPGLNYAQYFPNTVVRDTFTWTVQFSGVATNNTAALPIYNPPALGTNLGTYWDNANGHWVVGTVSNVLANFAAYVVANTNPPPVAPGITNQPASQTITNGNYVIFNVGVTGSPPLEYQWRFNGANLPGQIYSELLLTNVAPNQAGNYTVVLTNAAGSVTSQVALLTVLVPVAITSQPPSSLSAVLGDSLSFSVGTTGTPPILYQWYRQGLAVGGATNATYSIGSVSTNDTGIYYLTMTNAAGAAVSGLVSLSVAFGRTVFDDSENPGGQVVNSTNEFGNQITFGGNSLDRKITQFFFYYNLGTNGTGNEKLDLRFYDNAGMSNAPGLLIYDSGPVRAPVGPTGQSNITLYPFVEVPDTIIWTVQFSGLASNQVAGLPVYNPVVVGQGGSNYWENVGGTWLPGSVSNVTVNFGAYVAAITKSTNNPPVIHTQPQSLTRTNGDTAVLSVDVAGSYPLHYRWLWFGTNLAAPDNPLLTLTNVTPNLNGSYSVVITNQAGAVTSQVAVLTVWVPPTVQTQPQSQAVVIGTNVTFSVAASGTPPPGYQWNKNGTVIAGATNSFLQLNNVTTNDAGAYFVTVSNGAGATNSATANLAVALGWVVYNNFTNYTGFTLPPTAATNEYGDQITLGGDPLNRLVAQFVFEFNLTNTVTGSERVQLRFYSPNGTNNTPGDPLYESAFIPIKTGFNDITNYPYVAVPDSFVWTVQFSGLAARESPALSLYDPPVIGSSSASYWERSGGGWVSRTLAGRTINFGALVLANVKPTNQPPVIESQPLSLTATNGDNVSLTVSAIGSVPLSYQWQFNGANLAAANIPTLVLDNITTNQAGNYTVVITNSAGSVTSQVAAVTVLVPPTIQTQPQSQVVVIGTNVFLNVSAIGTAPLGYQWWFNNAPLPGAVGPLLPFVNATTNNSGAYAVVITNIAGVVTSAVATLQVVPPPRVGIVYDNTVNYLAQQFGTTNEFGNEILLAGSPLEHTVLQFRFKYFLSAGSSSPTARLKFYDNTGPNGAPNTLLYDSTPLPIVQGSNDFVVTPGIYVPSDFTWTVQFKAANGNPTVGLLIYNPPVVGSCSNAFWQRVNGDWALAALGVPATFGAQILSGPAGITAPVVTNQPLSQTVTEGSGVTLTVGVSGTFPLGYQWQFNGTNLAAATNASLVLNPITKAQGGSYQVTITNYAGAATSVLAVVTVTTAPPDITQPPTNVSLVLGTDVSLIVMASGSQPLTYQWQLNGTNLPGATNATLILHNVQVGAAGSYTVVVSNPGGQVTSPPALLLLPGAPGIDVQPVPRSASAGAGLTLSVTAHGTDLHYQWLFNGQPIGGATNSTLILNQLNAAQAGLYTVSITNVIGSTVSAPAALNLLSINLASGGMAQLTIVGPSGTKYRVDARDRLDATHNWGPQATVTLTNTPSLYLDTNSPSATIRFYRTIWLP